MIDHDVLDESTTDAFAAGRFNRVPLIDGSVHDEGTVAIAQGYDRVGNPVTASSYPSAIGSALKVRVNDVTALYPISTYDSPSRVLPAADTDDCFIRATMQDAGRIARYVSKTFLYESDEPDPGLFVQGGLGAIVTRPIWPTGSVCCRYPNRPAGARHFP